jgi:hypothetical protein
VKAIALTAAIIAVALAVVAAAVFGFGDRRTMVSPPEAVVENFVRALGRGRFPQAHKYLSTDARRGISVPRLAEATALLESRIGGIREVKGEKGWLAGDDAAAVALVKTQDARAVRLALRLRREMGEWRLVGIEGLAP